MPTANPAISAVEPCELLPWDTNFFGIKTARVLTGTMTPEIAVSVDNWCKTHGIQWLYFLANPNDPAITASAQRNGYKLVDVRMTFDRDPKGVTAASPIISPFLLADMPFLERIAAASFTDSRFYHDGRIPVEKCNELFVTWTRSSCQSDTDHILVARENGEAVGYVTCHADRESRNGTIGLIGVDSHHRGRGIGRNLLNASLTWAAGLGLQRMSVVTQARNSAARKLYERCGFVEKSSQPYFHKWYD